jgi:hypothetical protein
MSDPISRPRRADRSGALLTVATGLIAAVPAIVATIRAIADGWTPMFDTAIVATNAYDVLSGNGALTGVYSDASLPEIGTVYGLGPLLFWVLALPVRLLNDWQLATAICLMNTAVIVGVVALARRRGGPALMFATAAAIPLMTRSLSPESLHEPVNPSLGLLAILLLAFLAWSLVCGEFRLAPLTAFVGSFVLQVHYSFAQAAVALLAIAAVGLAVSLGSPAGRLRAARPWLLVALVVTLVCWAPMVVQQAAQEPGNLGRLIETAREPEKTTGYTVGWHALVGMIGVRPWWTVGPGTQGERLTALLGDPDALAVVTTGIVLGLLLVLLVTGVRTRRRDLVGATLIGLALSAAIVVTTASVPQRLGFSIEKAERWALPAGMFVLLAAGWSLVVTVAPALRERLRSVAPRVPDAAALAVCLGLLAAFSLAVALRQQRDPLAWAFDPVERTEALVADAVPEGTIRVDSDGGLTPFAFQTATIFRLRKEGHPVVAGEPQAQAITEKLGRSYRVEGKAPEATVTITEKAEIPGARKLATIPLPGARSAGGVTAPGRHVLRIFIDE